ncbi:MAG: M48 family metallopeptidase [Clostridium sp.]|nr:M48 family metallopeptidase [Clostridium sp.]
MKTIFIRGIPVTLDRRRIKNVNLYIRPPHGDVLVTAPMRLGEAQIMKFLHEKEEWIVRHRERVIARAQENREDSLRDMTQRSVTPGELARLKEQIAHYAQKWEPVMGVHCVHWTIRDMKSRWGSCSVTKKTIRINLQLVKKPEECLEYVIVHELTHLLEPSHNERFHAYMRQFLPDYKERKRLLEECGFQPGG